MSDVKKTDETLRDLEPKQDPKGGFVINWKTPVVGITPPAAPTPSVPTTRG